MRIQPGWRAALLRGAVLGTGLLGFAGNAAATPIDDKYAETGGGSGRLGMPTAAEAAAPDGVGKFRQFARGVIYWHPKIGAHMVIGLILARWSELGAEKGYLGYPMTDEIGTFDGSGRVSKFQGGELIWHSATNKVTEVRSTDLVVDLPFPPGEPWFVIQANAVTNSDSHRGPWAYCWDFDLAGKPQAASNGALFTAATDGPILHVDQKNKSVGLAGETNVIVERLGAGRYASYLHLRPDSYTRHFGASAGGAVPQGMPSGRWPVAKSGVVLAEVGDVGAGIGAFHLHFCITTRPDRPQYAPFESVPVAFRNYGLSTNDGRNWTHVAVGVPRQGQWVRREARPGPSAPQVNEAATPISYGKVLGQISAASALPGAGGAGVSKLTVAVVSAWGEMLASRTILVPGDNAAGPWPFELVDVPAFNNLRLSVTHEGVKGVTASGESAPFELRPNLSATVNVRLGK